MQSPLDSKSAEVLLVDDRAALEDTLVSSEYTLVRAHSEDAAHRYLAENEPALIVINLGKPKLDRLQKRARSIPIILVDGTPLPVDPETLRAKVLVFVRLFNHHRKLVEGVQKEAKSALQKAQRRSSLLSEARRLLTENFDKELDLDPVLDSVVPKFCDLVSIELYDGDRSTLTHQVGKAVPSLQADLEALRVASTVDPTPELVVSELYAEHPKKYLKSLKMGSFMVTPIFVQGTARGSLSMGLAQLKPRFTPDDLKMLEDLAALIGMASTNANLYRQAQEAIRSRDEFLSIASHELKTPLTPLKLQTQGLMRNLRAGTLATLSPERLKKMLESSERQISRLVKLVDDLLEISRISSGKLELAISEFDITDLIHEVTDRFSDQIAISGSPLILNLPEYQSVRWDPFRIEQVLVNLLTNAIRYGNGKQIEVNCTREGDEVRISFRDHGIGIARLDQARVFGRFERAVSGSHFGGLGLGLYIVSQIIESHRGKITLESDVGEGSTFTINLPSTYTPQNLG